MIRLFYLVSLSLVIVPSLAATAQQTTVPTISGVPAAVQQAAASIDAEKIRAHVQFLADDLLEGRGPGKRGAELAAKYIASQFAVEGLKPAGDNGTYFQRVPLYAVHTVEDQTTFTFDPAPGSPLAAPIRLAYGQDVVTKDTTGEATADINAPIVFVGYGIDAPEYQWNDYAGIDVKGKVLLLIVNEPPSSDPKFFKAEALTYYGRWTYKYEQAARLGAVGVLIIHRTDLASYPWGVVRNSQAIEKSFLQGDPSATLKAASWIQHDVADKLLASIHMTADQAIDAAGKRGFKAVELPVRLEAHIVSNVRRYESANVIAMVPGTGTTPGHDQAVIYSAHYDHLGLDPDAKGDGIYNGAADNGTGCGIVLELARAWTAVKPPHSIYFAAVTAEEQGLLGSEYLGMHPPVPAAQISLDLNYDMLLPVGIPTAIGAAGSERTSFYPVVESTAKAFGFTIEPDPRPMAGSYYRSDHFSFARAGIPAFSIEQGTLFEGQTPEWGKAQLDDYIANHYHQPSDEYHDTMDFRGNAKLARFGFILGWQASALPATVGWQPGDEFEAARKKSGGIERYKVQMTMSLIPVAALLMALQQASPGLQQRSTSAPDEHPVIVLRDHAKNVVPEDASGLYLFADPGLGKGTNFGEGIQIDEQFGDVTGYLTTKASSGGSKGTLVGYFFSRIEGGGGELSFTTKPIHGVWYSFEGRLDRGPAQSKALTGYYLLNGTLVTHDDTQQSVQRRTLSLKQTAQH